MISPSVFLIWSITPLYPCFPTLPLSGQLSLPPSPPLRPRTLFCACCMWEKQLADQLFFFCRTSGRLSVSPPFRSWMIGCCVLLFLRPYCRPLAFNLVLQSFPRPPALPPYSYWLFLCLRREVFSFLIGSPSRPGRVSCL